MLSIYDYMYALNNRLMRFGYKREMIFVQILFFFFFMIFIFVMKGLAGFVHDVSCFVCLFVWLYSALILQRVSSVSLLQSAEKL